MKMNRIYALILMLMISAFAADAQKANAIIFTENGERFTIILNGLRQNEKPETNVKIEGLTAVFYKMKVIFENTALGENNFNMNIELGTETTYVIKKNNKNEYVLRPMSIVPIAEAPQTSSSTSVNTYNPNAPVYTPSETVTHQTTTTTSGTPAGGVSMGMNVGDAGGNFSMNISATDNMGATTTQQTTITTTTTTSSSNYNSTPPPPAPAVVYLPGYAGAIGCPVPMERSEFESMKGSIGSKTFEDSKLTVAKQIINSNCLLAGQVREIMMLFTYEDSKLDFAKYAYGRTYDIGNYYKVNYAFTFESSIDDLNTYINSRH
jgi:hypothetical protein